MFSFDFLSFHGAPKLPERPSSFAQWRSKTDLKTTVAMLASPQAQSLALSCINASATTCPSYSTLLLKTPSLVHVRLVIF